MISLNNREFSGYVVEQNDEVDAIIHSADYIVDIIKAVDSAREVIDNTDGRNAIKVNYFMGAKEVSPHVYCLRYGTKPTLWDNYDKVIQEQSQMIDSLLVMMLEG